MSVELTGGDEMGAALRDHVTHVPQNDVILHAVDDHLHLIHDAAAVLELALTCPSYADGNRRTSSSLSISLMYLVGKPSIVCNWSGIWPPKRSSSTTNCWQIMRTCTNMYAVCMAQSVRRATTDQLAQV